MIAGVHVNKDGCWRLVTSGTLPSARQPQVLLLLSGKDGGSRVRAAACRAADQWRTVRCRFARVKVRERVRVQPTSRTAKRVGAHAGYRRHERQLCVVRPTSVVPRMHPQRGFGCGFARVALLAASVFVADGDTFVVTVG
jgi:hypothetical protein